MLGRRQSLEECQPDTEGAGKEQGQSKGNKAMRQNSVNRNGLV